MTFMLAIETSCDDTAVAILKEGRIVSNLISSQIKQHSKFGGVVPELASRLHTEKINSLIDRALEDAGITFKELTSCACTIGPGLEGALLVGMTVAKTISKTLSIPLIPVNHIKGHIFAHLADHDAAYPFIALIVSGGHTQLVLVRSSTSFEILGKTRDDAAGEVFDKVARALGLGYPGGPVIERHAKKGDPERFKFTIPMKHDGLEFSFSGLKTAVIQEIHSFKEKNIAIPIDDLCASFQHVVMQTLLIKTMRACHDYNINRLILGGGVIANSYIVHHFSQQPDLDLITIPKILCTDNAAMIGLAAHFLPKETFESSQLVYPGLQL